MKDLRSTNLTADDASLPATSEGMPIKHGVTTFFPTANATFTVLFLVGSEWKKAQAITTEDPFTLDLQYTTRVTFTATGVTGATNLQVLN